MRGHRLLVPVCALALPGWGQGFHAGLKAGVPITQYFENGIAGNRSGTAEYSAATRRYTFGLSGEWRLTNAFGFELDVLYHRMGYVGIVNYPDSGNGGPRRTAIDVKGSSWDFPLFVKYRMCRTVRPYMAGGGVLRYVGPVRGRGEATTGAGVTAPIDTSEPAELSKRFYSGLTAAFGVEAGGERVRFLPELRYTRWTSNIREPTGLLRFAPDQFEFLLGLLF